MEAWRPPTHREHRKYPTPIIALSVICCLVGTWALFTSGLTGADLQLTPLVLSGILLGLISLFEIRVGLAVLLLAVGLSPELSINGVTNFRIEDLIFPILFVVWITKHVANKERFASTDLKAPIFLLLFLALVSSLNNHIYGGLDLRTATFRFGKGVEYYFIFLLVLNSFSSFRELRGFVVMLLLTSSLVGLYGLFQFGLQGGGDAGFRITGPPGETANILGGYYVFHMCLAVGLLPSAKPGHRGLILAYLGMMLLPFMGTLSRTSYVALFSGVMVIWFLSRNRSIGLVFTLVALFSLLAPVTTAERFWSIFDVFGTDAPASWVSRVDGWKALLSAAIETPVLGRGVGRYPLGAVDNEYVLQINEIGIVGLLAFVWLISRCLKTSYRLLSERSPGRPHDPMLRGFSLGYFGGLTALLVHSLGATTFTTIRTTEPFFFASGILYCYWNLTHTRRATAPGAVLDKVETRIGHVAPPRPSWRQPSPPAKAQPTG
ncbi:MAG: O-antigen ligase family protein [Planctomycetota bacterium]